MSTKHWSAELISLKSAAALVDVDPKTIRNWIDDGKLQGFKLNGQFWRVYRREVLSLARPIGVVTSDGVA